MKTNAVARSILGILSLMLVTYPILGEGLSNEDIVAMFSADLGASTIIAKVRQAERVDFDVSTEALIKLRKAGVPQDVITAMLDRVSPPASSGNVSRANETWTVKILSAGTEQNLTKMQGSADHSMLRLGTTTYHNFPGTRAKVRLPQGAVVLLIASQSQPIGQYYVVKTDVVPKKNLRSVKVGHGFYGMSDANAPDPDWTIPYEATETEKGLWRLTIPRSLVPGEYGVFVANSNLLGTGELFDFGID